MPTQIPVYNRDTPSDDRKGKIYGIISQGKMPKPGVVLVHGGQTATMSLLNEDLPYLLPVKYLSLMTPWPRIADVPSRCVRKRLPVTGHHWHGHSQSLLLLGLQKGPLYWVTEKPQFYGFSLVLHQYGCRDPGINTTKERAARPRAESENFNPVLLVSTGRQSFIDPSHCWRWLQGRWYEDESSTHSSLKWLTG